LAKHTIFDALQFGGEYKEFEHVKQLVLLSHVRHSVGHFWHDKVEDWM